MSNLRKLLTTLIFTAAFMLLPCLAMLPVQAEGTDDYIEYTGEELTFATADGSAFKMMAPQEGTTYELQDENVVIHYVPKNTTVYNGIHWGLITDTELTKDVSFNEDGTFDITLPATACGHGVPVAPIKVSDPTATTSTQYYLCIPPRTSSEADYIDYAGYDVTFTKDNGDAFGMFSPQDGTTCEIQGDNVVIHYVPNNKTVYGWLHWGLITDSFLTQDLALNEDGTMDITLPKTVCGKGLPIAPIKKKDGNTTRSQYYLCIPSEKILVGEELAITNNTGMFKVVTATLKENAAGKYVQVALSKESYHFLYKGTYDEAVANGDNRDNWIAGYVNSAGKWEFNIPLAEGENTIPVVSISNTYLTKYENGENPLERAFYPRQLSVDTEAKTLIADDFKGTDELALTNNTKLFNPTAASLETTGGPNSNGYKIDLNLTMSDDTYDFMVIGDAESAQKDSAEVFALSDEKVFTATVEKIVTPGDPSTIVSQLDTPITVSFRDKATKVWRERTVEIKKADKTITFDNVDEDQATVENAEALIEEAGKTYSTAAEKQAAVDAAKAAYDALTDAQKEELKKTVADPEAAIDDAQKAADDQKTAEEEAAAKDDTEDAADDTVKVGTTATVGKFKYKVASATAATLVKPVKKTNKKLTIPATVKIKNKTFKVTAIANNAFKNNKKLQAVTIGNKVTKIGNNAFLGCKKLKKIVIPASVITVGNNAFKNCAAAKTITLGKKVKKIGKAAFLGCKKASKLTIKGTAITSIGKKAFAKTGIKKLKAPKKKRAALRKKLINAGMKKTVK